PGEEEDIDICKGIEHTHWDHRLHREALLYRHPESVIASTSTQDLWQYGSQMRTRPATIQHTVDEQRGFSREAGRPGTAGGRDDAPIGRVQQDRIGGSRVQSATITDLDVGKQASRVATPCGRSGSAVQGGEHQPSAGCADELGNEVPTDQPTIPADEGRLQGRIDIETGAGGEQQIPAPTRGVDEAPSVLRYELEQAPGEVLAGEERAECAELVYRYNVAKPATGLTIEMRC
ncbi:MAG TPA: hypothetical protein VFF79_04900, partial [Conexibacter sp.]|nr:hypothetical protein [Conexibacter sp.]